MVLPAAGGIRAVCSVSAVAIVTTARHAPRIGPLGVSETRCGVVTLGARRIVVRKAKRVGGSVTVNQTVGMAVEAESVIGP